jgi:hypothetical protein
MPVKHALVRSGLFALLQTRSMRDKPRCQFVQDLLNQTASLDAAQTLEEPEYVALMSRLVESNCISKLLLEVAWLTYNDATGAFSEQL